MTIVVWLLLVWLLLALPVSVVIGLCIGSGLSEDPLHAAPGQPGPA